MEVQFSGAELSPDDKNLLRAHIDKLAKPGVEVDSLAVNIKKHDKAGNRHKFSTHLRAENSSGLFVSESTEWNLAVSMRVAFKKLEKELRK